MAYDHAGTDNYQHRVIRAEGVGSLIDLSRVATITGGTFYDNRLFIQAVNGGEVNLEQVESITDAESGNQGRRSIDVTRGRGRQSRATERAHVLHRSDVVRFCRGDVFDAGCSQRRHGRSAGPALRKA